MATLNPGRALAAIRLPAVRHRNGSLRKLFPRRCMLFSTATLLAGFAVSLLMIVGVLPLNLLMCFVSWSLIAVGGELVLIFWGEF